LVRCGSPANRKQCTAYMHCHDFHQFSSPKPNFQVEIKSKSTCNKDFSRFARKNSDFPHLFQLSQHKTHILRARAPPYEPQPTCTTPTRVRARAPSNNTTQSSLKSANPPSNLRSVRASRAYARIRGSGSPRLARRGARVYARVHRPAACARIAAMPSEIYDLGNGFTYIKFAWTCDRELNPQFDDCPDVGWAGIIMTCPHGNQGTIRFVISGHRLYQGGWTVESWDPLTVSPSVQFLNPSCCHGFIREGKWVGC